ncbi:MAG TPA: hypothetical protein VN108_10455 [Marmoricola sp.]|nr:hypothetical protein [Marmoricola sp.]
MKIMSLPDRIWVALQILRMHAFQVSQEWDQFSGKKTTITFGPATNFDGMPLNRRAKKEAR